MVGLFSVPLYGITYFNVIKPTSIIWYVLWFFIGTPHIYSSLIMAAIAVDRMFLISLAQKYENIVTLKVLKVIFIILLLCCFTFGFVTAWIMSKWQILPSLYFYWVFAKIILTIVVPLVIMLAHFYLLIFVLRRRDLKQLRIHHRKNCNNKLLTKTIICICISQLILVLPY